MKDYSDFIQTLLSDILGNLFPEYNLLSVIVKLFRGGGLWSLILTGIFMLKMNYFSSLAHQYEMILERGFATFERDRYECSSSTSFRNTTGDIQRRAAIFYVSVSRWLFPALLLLLAVHEA